jgi:hypothetical protein
MDVVHLFPSECGRRWNIHCREKGRAELKKKKKKKTEGIGHGIRLQLARFSKLVSVLLDYGSTPFIHSGPVHFTMFH